jgi:hypothetical protein
MKLFELYEAHLNTQVNTHVNTGIRIFGYFVFQYRSIRQYRSRFAPGLHEYRIHDSSSLSVCTHTHTW